MTLLTIAVEAVTESLNGPRGWTTVWSIFMATAVRCLVFVMRAVAVPGQCAPFFPECNRMEDAGLN